MLENGNDNRNRLLHQGRLSHGWSTHRRRWCNSTRKRRRCPLHGNIRLLILFLDLLLMRHRFLVQKSVQNFPHISMFRDQSRRVLRRSSGRTAHSASHWVHARRSAHATARRTTHSSHWRRWSSHSTSRWSAHWRHPSHWSVFVQDKIAEFHDRLSIGFADKKSKQVLKESDRTVECPCDRQIGENFLKSHRRHQPRRKTCWKTLGWTC